MTVTNNFLPLSGRDAQFNLPVPTSPKRKTPHRQTKVVLGTELLPRLRCNLCKGQFRSQDAVIVVEDLSNFADDPCCTHRRCMEELLGNSVDDEPKMKAQFEDYRAKLQEKYDA